MARQGEVSWRARAVTGHLTAIKFQRDSFVIARLRPESESEPGAAGAIADDAGAAVALDGDGMIAIKGTMLAPQLGARYALTGSWETHPRWGDSFAFSSYEVSYPTRAEDVISYLRELPGIGPTIAAAIVAAFGGEGDGNGDGPGPEAAIHALRERPAEVAERIPRLGLARAEAAAEHLRAGEASEAALLEVKHLCGGTAVGRPAIQRILDKWGRQAPDVIRATPYALAEEIRGIGFLTADQVARRLPAPHTVALDSPSRIAAGMAHVLEGMANEGGHTCLPTDAFLALCGETLGLARPALEAQLAPAHERGLIQVTVEAHEPEPPAGGHVYSPRLLRAEHEVARHLLELLAVPVAAPGEGTAVSSPGAVSSAPEPPSSALVGLQDDQRDALRLAWRSRVLLLTGAPGTGKTHTLRALLDAATLPRAEGGLGIAAKGLALCAPTGKAAKRMFEATGRQASTIHMLLKPSRGGQAVICPREDCRARDDDRKAREGARWTCPRCSTTSVLRPIDIDSRDVGGFTRDQHHPLECEMLVCDEVSMLDISLARSLLCAIPRGCRVVLVGDSHQLPSVGPGNVLADLVSSRAIPHVELRTIKRQDPGLIVRNCHAIKDGKPPTWIESPLLPIGEDFALLESSDPEEIRRLVLDLVADMIPDRFGIDRTTPEGRARAVRDVQVLGPLREKTALGCESLNAALQERLNPESEANRALAGVSWGLSSRFRLGDKLIQLRNDYRAGGGPLINGDIGYLAEWLPAGADERRGGTGDGKPALRVLFEAPEREIIIPAAKNDLDLAYALTVHKFQGSEAPAVVIPMHRCFGGLIVQRNWVYTAISRAKRLCVIVGEAAALRAGCRRVGQSRRCSRLAAHLRRGRGEV